MVPSRILAFACLLALCGCSYAYEIEAVMIDGRLAFVPSPEMRSRAKCVSRAEVMPVDYALSSQGEPHAVWAQRTYAWLDHGGHDCVDHFPVFYGAALRGVGEGGPLRTEVAPKALEVGVVYSVAVTAGATGYGGGRFRLRADGTVENLPPRS